MVLHSAKYMSQSASEIADMVFGLPRMNREIRKLRGMGYHVKNALVIAQNKPDDNTVVYTSRAFQPYAEAFDEAHYRFVGPSVREVEPQGKGGRPLVFASLGTVINDRPDFYRTLIEALHDEDVDLLESCGKAFCFRRRTGPSASQTKCPACCKTRSMQRGLSR